ncbi:MAG: ABC transporter permease [Gammaproteobacteria bacterium]|nr:MAG: ABC transporter permease [Gammaproteobacteria bacterium]
MQTRHNPARVFYPVDVLGRALMSHIYLLIDIFALAWLALRSAWLEKPNSSRSILGEVLHQVYFTGWQAMPIIFALGLLTGSAAILQAVSQFNVVGGQEVVGKFLVLTIVREVAPLLTALIVIARSATAVSTQLGNMRANAEIEALQVMGIHPYSFVVYPRLMGGILSVGALSFYFVFFALFGGYGLTAFFHEMDPRFYFDVVLSALGEPEGWFVFVFKVVVNAVLIFSIACYYGLHVRRNHHDVPVATTRAVMRCLSYVVTFNVGTSVLFYLLLFAIRGEL